MSKIKKRLIRIIVSVCLFIIALLISLLTSPNWYINFIIYLPSYIIIGYDIIKKAFRNIIYGRLLDENFLMTVATIGAFAIGEFMEGVAVMIFYQAGELFQTIAVRKSRQSVTKLMDIRPEFANVVNDNNEITTVSPEDVKIGDIIEIKPGEKIPLDAVVISGSGNVNKSMLTGESIPQAVNIGDKLISGSINIDGVFRAKVMSEYHNSTVSKILNLIQDAQEKKAKSENFITKFAIVYTPIVCIFALILAIIPPIFVGGWADWIYRALCFLVVSCPCALVISIPLSFFAGIGCASKHGILIKGSSYIERLTQIDTMIFDKTGTLTKGKFKIHEILPNNKREEILKLATIAEYKSVHPIAKAVLDENIKVSIKGYEYTNILGEGVIAKKDKDVIIAGNEKLLTDNGISNIPIIKTCHSIIHIAHNNKYIGAIIIGDEIKEESSSVISSLIYSNIKPIMISGDNREIAENIAQLSGIAQYYYNMLPDDKINKLESIMKDSKSVAFVGDGINDSPSLVRADIGISMGQIGSDSAIEASDVVIMNDNLKKIVTATKIAKKTMRIVRQNIIFALGVKIAILILSALGLSNMWWAVFGDVGVSVLAILNAIRALNYKDKK